MRRFTNAKTGRSVAVREGTRLERLVEADDNWTENVPKSQKEASTDGAGNPRGRSGVARSKSDADGGKPRRRTSRKS